MNHIKALIVDFKTRYQIIEYLSCYYFIKCKFISTITLSIYVSLFPKYNNIPENTASTKVSL